MSQPREVPQTSADQRTTEVLGTYTAFEFFAEQGLFEVYDVQDNVVRRESDETSFQNGGLVFRITSATRGEARGGQGTASVEVLRNEDSVRFVEKGPTYTHVLIVEDVWQPKEQGFRATYLRVLGPNELDRSHRLVSTFLGYASPIPSSP